MDLFLGSQTRQHNDLDIGVLRRDAMSIVAMLADWEVFEAKGGLLTQLPPRRAPRADVNSLWCRPEGASEWVLELMLNDAEEDSWVYRRNRSINCPLQIAIRRNCEGIPYLAPEIQLLFKSRAPRPQDIADFLAVSPRLDLAARGWLKDALLKGDPYHPWLPVLGQRPGCD
jgi:hypothetical protein